ncbi:hypothetical protein Rhe02_32680 [Rhizocola hellebori]|uniref:Secreted protein n=1 Tax=Rhizocola hellebori TaxID=1392758 RepID=A0A8J3VGM9_9ACTN|nr:hypothetical protein [Rhizocola hellebori]GIH05201.1 hypothetical protein Rhe02_32680 [Rhizocola hellebori]
MKAPLKLSLYGLGLLLIFAAALGAGRLAGPTGLASEEVDMNGDGHNQGHQSPTPQAAPPIPGGVQIAQDGYRLDLASTTLSSTGTHPLTFSVIGPDGKPVTSFTAAHEKDLHLIVVRRDLTGFQHLHPVLGDGGVWSVPLTVDRPGAYRVFADFRPAAHDKGLILGADATAPGDYQPRPLAPPSRTTTVDDYTVTLDGDLVPGTSSKLTLTVSKDGRPVTDLQPYLGAFGHLVALRDGDLAYLHVHPEESKIARPQIVFYAEVPSSGGYGLFLDFQHQGIVRTAAFTAATHGTTAPAASPTPAPSASGHGHN